MKKTGIELIAIERLEQIEKHGFTLEKFDQYYKKSELLDAAEFCICPEDEAMWPADWDVEFMIKIQLKSRVNQLIVAGAFIAAEIDRLNNLK